MAINKLNPGKCRHQFVIKKNSLTSTDLDSLGREQVTEVDVATIKAEFRKLTGEEQTQANQQFGLATHELACWFVPSIDTTMWLIGFNGRRYNIVDIDNVDERNSWLHMTLASESS
jgi:SPP1 family predicted phage head-tail adaptor